MRKQKDVKAVEKEVLRAVESGLQRSREIEEAARAHIQNHLEELMRGNNVFGEPKTIQDIAEHTKLSRAAIRKYTLCKHGGSASAVPSAVALCKLADYFRVTPNYLLGYSGESAASSHDAAQKLVDAACQVTGLQLDTVRKLRLFQQAAERAENGADTAAALNRLVSAAAESMLRLLEEPAAREDA